MARKRHALVRAGNETGGRTLQVGSDHGALSDSEEMRAFLQRRLSMFGLCVFLLAGTSWIALTAGSLLVGSAGPNPHTPLSFASLLHVADTLLGGLLWLATRGVRRQADVLHKLDVGVTLGLVVVWVSLACVIPDRTIGAQVAILAFLTGTLARAIVVPSTAARTLFIGIAGSVFLVGVASWRAATGQTPIVAAIALTCWTVSGVVLGTIASHTIFGLRREALQARVLGQYTLDTKIGEGGMGVVWRASHALLRRPTAVKLVAPQHISDHAIRRFEREVQLTARLTHPNSVAIYDYGRARDGTFYYAMEYLDGIDLERLVGEHGPQPPGRVVHLLSQICGALAEAHDLGLVHRDVKPANVLIAPRSGEHEVAKIVDFGLAKSIELEASSGGASGNNKLTGTPLYMSPEAIQAPESVDGRSDIYGLGAVAWFLLVGRPPFEGKSVIEICARHLHEPPLSPHVALGRPLATDLEDIVLACLEKNADARPLDARALRARLETCSANKDWTKEEATEFWRARADSTPPESAPPTTRTVDDAYAARAPGLNAESSASG